MDIPYQITKRCPRCWAVCQWCDSTQDQVAKAGKCLAHMGPKCDNVKTAVRREDCTECDGAGIIQYVRAL